MVSMDLRKLAFGGLSDLTKLPNLIHHVVTPKLLICQIKTLPIPAISVYLRIQPCHIYCELIVYYFLVTVARTGDCVSVCTGQQE